MYQKLINFQDCSFHEPKTLTIQLCFVLTTSWAVQWQPVRQGGPSSNNNFWDFLSLYKKSGLIGS